MSGSNNFLQWNPLAANQEDDTTYNADSLRSGGAGTGAVFPSPTANKLFFQVSTMVAALAAALAAKSYNMLDSNISNLETALGNILTQADITQSLTANGYIKLPGGLVLQWGHVTTDINGGTLAVSFPLVFPTGVFGVLPVTLSSTDRITYVVSGSVSTSGFTVANNGSSGFAYWFAIGH